MSMSMDNATVLVIQVVAAEAEKQAFKDKAAEAAWIVERVKHHLALLQGPKTNAKSVSQQVREQTKSTKKSKGGANAAAETDASESDGSITAPKASKASKAPKASKPSKANTKAKSKSPAPKALSSAAIAAAAAVEQKKKAERTRHNKELKAVRDQKIKDQAKAIYNKQKQAGKQAGKKRKAEAEATVQEAHDESDGESESESEEEEDQDGDESDKDENGDDGSEDDAANTKPTKPAKPAKSAKSETKAKESKTKAKSKSNDTDKAKDKSNAVAKPVDDAAVAKPAKRPRRLPEVVLRDKIAKAIIQLETKEQKMKARKARQEQNKEKAKVTKAVADKRKQDTIRIDTIRGLCISPFLRTQLATDPSIDPSKYFGSLYAVGRNALTEINLFTNEAMRELLAVVVGKEQYPSLLATLGITTPSVTATVTATAVAMAMDNKHSAPTPTPLVSAPTPTPLVLAPPAIPNSVSPKKSNSPFSKSLLNTTTTAYVSAATGAASASSVDTGSFLSLHPALAAALSGVAGVGHSSPAAPPASTPAPASSVLVAETQDLSLVDMAIDSQATQTPTQAQAQAQALADEPTKPVDKTPVLVAVTTTRRGGRRTPGSKTAATGRKPTTRAAKLAAANAGVNAPIVYSGNNMTVEGTSSSAPLAAAFAKTDSVKPDSGSQEY